MKQTTIELGLGSIEILAGLTPEQRAGLAARCQKLSLKRGEILVRQGDAADALYLAISGRFAVSVAGRRAPVTEIGPGQPIGEIAFLTGGVRTATVTAMRDSLVLKLGREEFESLSKDDPTIWRSLAVTLAGRVAATTAAAVPPPDPRPRTICLIRAGTGALPSRFLENLVSVFRANARTLVAHAANAAEFLSSAGGIEGPEATHVLNDLEARYDYVLYVADPELTAWSEKAIRHADLVIAAGVHASDPTPNVLERRAAKIVSADARRLVLVHERRARLTGTARWLEKRDVVMHHHVALDTLDDTERLYRFIAGTARGLVACGGGALCPAHVGVYRALIEAGHSFDIMGGTSAGSAMVAAFILRSTPDEIIASIHDMFVANKAMGRYTVPRYSLLDHTNFDAQLKRYFGGNDIEDLWLPYFAVSTNLSSYTVHQHRRGDLWTAIRASASIPVLLPPIYTAGGEMLVDGGLLDNVPIRPMRELKSGPNVVISFLLPEMERFDVNYASLPTRAELMRWTLNPLARSKMPPAPSLVTVLMRSLMANRQDYQRHLGRDDTLLVPPIPADIGFLDWHRHKELYEKGYAWAKAELERRAAKKRESDSDPRKCDERR